MSKLSLASDIGESANFLGQLVELSFSNTLLALQTVREGQAKDGKGSKEIQAINEVL